jgi:hypothetical protein
MILLRSRFFRCPALLAFAALAAVTESASGVELYAYPSTIEQFGSGSAFYLGHTVMAGTNYNNLSAGGTYIVQCDNPATLPISGERALSSSTLGFSRNQLTVTIPAQQPALANITGWTQVEPGSQLACNYRWTAFATEGGYSIGAGGISFPIGNGTARIGNTVDFTMIRANTAGGGGGCSP